MKQATKRTAASAQAANATEIFALLEQIPQDLPDCMKATWSDVGSSRHALDLLVQAAFALGQITEEEAATRYCRHALGFPKLSRPFCR